MKVDLCRRCLEWACECKPSDKIEAIKRPPRADDDRRGSWKPQDKRGR